MKRDGARWDWDIKNRDPGNAIIGSAIKVTAIMALRGMVVSFEI